MYYSRLRIGWLVGRQQRVVLNGQFSGWRKVISGVLQGSVLGTLLFVIYINGIDESVACRILKFADDTKIYNAVKSSEDIDNLQACLLYTSPSPRDGLLSRMPSSA